MVILIDGCCVCYNGLASSVHLSDLMPQIRYVKAYLKLLFQLSLLWAELKMCPSVHVQVFLYCHYDRIK